MSLMKTLFGSSDPLGQLQNQNPYLQQQTQARYNQQIGMQQSMAGGGMVTAAMASAAEKQATEAFMKGYGANVQKKTRDHIANEVQKMAEEMNAPTLLYAVVLAIRNMEIPE